MAISKNKLKDLASYRIMKRCEEEGVYVVEGVKMADEALASGATVRVVCATAGWYSSHNAESATEQYEVGVAELERISLMKNPNQVWMLLDRQQVPVLPASASPLVVALDRLQDPGNMGTIMRTADWFGVRRIVASPDTVSCYNPKVVQASMGAIFRTQVEYTDLAPWLSACGMPVYGASLQGRPLPEMDLPSQAAVLLIGNESRGISSEVMRCVTHPVLIPNVGGTAESLNAAVAAGILMNHFCN